MGRLGIGWILWALLCPPLLASNLMRNDEHHYFACSEGTCSPRARLQKRSFVGPGCWVPLATGAADPLADEVFAALAGAAPEGQYLLVLSRRFARAAKAAEAKRSVEVAHNASSWAWDVGQIERLNASAAELDGLIADELSLKQRECRQQRVQWALRMAPFVPLLAWAGVQGFLAHRRIWQRGPLGMIVLKLIAGVPLALIYSVCWAWTGVFGEHPEWLVVPAMLIVVLLLWIGSVAFLFWLGRCATRRWT